MGKCAEFTVTRDHRQPAHVKMTVCVKRYQRECADTRENTHRRSTLLVGHTQVIFPCSSLCFSVMRFPISQQVLTELDARHHANHILFIVPFNPNNSRHRHRGV